MKNQLQVFSVHPNFIRLTSDNGDVTDFRHDTTYDEIKENLNDTSKDVYSTLVKMVEEGKFQNGHVTVSDKLRFYDENNDCFLQANISKQNAVTIFSVKEGDYRFFLF